MRTGLSRPCARLNSASCSGVAWRPEDAHGHVDAEHVRGQEDDDGDEEQREDHREDALPQEQGDSPRPPLPFSGRGGQAFVVVLRTELRLGEQRVRCDLERWVAQIGHAVNPHSRKSSMEKVQGTTTVSVRQTQRRLR